MKIGNSVYLYVGKRFSAKVGRGNNPGTYSDIYAKVVSGDGEVIELKVLYEVGYGDGISFNKVVKCVITLLEEVLVVELLQALVMS